ncbi:hypothetical protein NDU88_003836 [Pleurodeles waltl]|uniref:Uncharacterized protein n=1 Tax=Pleurodeles waltl TaxID=8319 RepID=A0AAV7WTK9_PLEWA|nr:hypothetical protein NDU88_003836 [Pleurodeles waltl]
MLLGPAGEPSNTRRHRGPRRKEARLQRRASPLFRVTDLCPSSPPPKPRGERSPLAGAGGRGICRSTPPLMVVAAARAGGGAPLTAGLQEARLSVTGWSVTRGRGLKRAGGRQWLHLLTACSSRRLHRVFTVPPFRSERRGEEGGSKEPSYPAPCGASLLYCFGRACPTPLSYRRTLVPSYRCTTVHCLRLLVSRYATSSRKQESEIPFSIKYSKM